MANKYRMILTHDWKGRMKQSDFSAPTDKEAIKRCAEVLKWEMDEHDWEFGEVAIELSKRNPQTGRYRRAYGIEVGDKVYVTDLRA